MLADRAKNISTSATIMIAAETKKLMAQGKDIIDLGVGEPDFNTPDEIKSSGKVAIDKNVTKYTYNQGMIELRQAIASKLEKENDLVYNTNEIIVTSGAKQGVYNGLFVLVNPGEEVIIPAPYWVSYPSMVALTGGKSVIVDDTNFNPKIKAYWKELANCYNIEFHIEAFDTPVEVCIERDKKREKSVGMHVILNMYNTYLSKEKPLDGDKK